MCGIAGIFTRQFTAQETLTKINDRMLSRLRHRGPDGEGRWFAPSGQAVLGHTRLAVIGLGDAGLQPKESAGHAVTCNGEIYNYRALRKDLEAAGITVKTPTDTEVLLELLRQGEPDLPLRLRGMFAFAHWDENNRRGRLVRDPLGVKPLYYYRSPEGDLYFASEIRALLASDKITRRLSISGLYGYLRMGSAPEPDTMVEGIRLLQAGHELHWQNGEIEVRRYWDTAEGYGRTTEVDLGDALRDTVRHHFESDVPVGIFLSGGKDSASLLSVARQLGHENVKTFTVGSHDRSIDESARAKLAAAHYGSEHHEVLLGPEAATDWFEDFLRAIDQPSLDGFNTWLVSRLAHETGTKVVLSGLGADELFGGYDVFNSVPKLLGLARKLGPARSVFGGLFGLFDGITGNPRAARIGEFLRGAPAVGRAYTAARSVFTHSEAVRLGRSWGLDIPDAQAAEFDRANALEPSGELAGAVSQECLRRYLRNQLLRDSDVMSMAHSLELRVPFVDRLFVETLNAMDSASRFAENKDALIRAVGDLPEFIVKRSRQGFVLPFTDWLSRGPADRLERLRRFPVKPRNWYRSWSLLVLNEWICQNIGDGAPS